MLDASYLPFGWFYIMCSCAYTSRASYGVFITENRELQEGNQLYTTTCTDPRTHLGVLW